MKTRSKDKVYLTFKLNWNDFKFQNVRPKNAMYPGPTSRKKLDQNTTNFINWALRALKKHSTFELPKDKNYNSMALTMNSTNVDKLHDLMHPFDWLNFAPVLDDKLSDSEYGIYPNKIIVDDPEYNQ